MARKMYDHKVKEFKGLCIIVDQDGYISYPIGWQDRFYDQPLNVHTATREEVKARMLENRKRALELARESGTNEPTIHPYNTDDWIERAYRWNEIGRLDDLND